jgi:gliding motility-associated protein GldL
MSAEETKFDIWWNSPSVRRMVGIIYSLGASVVIIGAMFKILHLQFASEVLGTGMTVEAVLFALGIFDKPHKEYEWDKIFHFEQGVMHQLADNKSSVSQVNVSGGTNKSINYTESISEQDTLKLSESIKNLSDTAQQLTGIANAVGATESYTKNIDAASQVAGKFVQSQESLNTAATKLVTSYQGISADMEEVVKNTKNYDKKIEDINKSLASINSIYELQLKSIQTQTEGLTTQNEQIRQVSSQLDGIVSDTQKIKVASETASVEIEKYKDGTVKLSKQITDLNQVYGNMLNALN